jgi:hypothetical protein
VKTPVQVYYAPKNGRFFSFFLPQLETKTCKLTSAMPQFAFCLCFSVFEFGWQSLPKSKKNPPFRGGIPGGHIMPVFFDFTPFSLFPVQVLNLSRKSAGNRPFKLNVN